MYIITEYQIYIREKLIEIWGEMDETIIINGDFNTLFQTWTDLEAENQ